MRTRTAKLAKPFLVDVKQLASFFPEFRYRGPVPKDFISAAITSEYILDDNADDYPIHFLSFDDTTSDGFTKVMSNYSAKELTVLLSRLPKELFDKLTIAFKGTNLELCAFSDEELDKLKRKLDENRTEALREKHEKDEKLKSLQAPMRGLKRVDFKKSDSMTVLQHEYAITNAESEKPVLGTFGAGPCLILALYDDKNKVAMLAHIDALTNLTSLSILFSRVSKENTVAHLFGGNLSSKAMCIDVADLVERNNIKIVNADIVRFDFSSASLAIDSRTGSIYEVEPQQLESDKNMDARLRLVGLQFMPTAMTQVYDGTRFKNSPKAEERLELTEEKKDTPKSPLISIIDFDMSLLSRAALRSELKKEKETYCRLRPGFLTRK